MQLINQHEIYETWAPILESKTGIQEKGKLDWLTKYCHYHSLNESAGAYNSLGVLNGMGNVTPAGNYGANAGPAGFYAGGSYNGSNVGSGDKFPSLLPLAIQVAAKTVGFDIVPVIPLSGPTGVLSYLDYVYAGGKLAGAADTTSPYTANTPDLIKVPISTTSPVVTAMTAGTDYLIFVGGAAPTSPLSSGNPGIMGTFVGNSRIDGFPIFRVIGITSGKQVNDAVTSASIIASIQTHTQGTLVFSGTLTTVAYVDGNAQLVKTLEDHVQGFSGAGVTGANAWQGPYVDGTLPYDPMNRNTGESSYFKSLGLSTFTKFIEAGTFQVAASVTTEQIQDLNKQFGIDVVSMIENALVNEVSQAINKHILSRAFALGWSNHYEFANTELGGAASASLNLTLTTSGTAQSTKTFVGKDGTVATSPTIFTPAYISGTSFENQSTVQRRLFSRILAAANVVANRGRRGPANFIVTNSQIASALQDISQFTFAPFTNTLTQNNGTLYPVGSIAGMTVYVDQNMSFNDTRVCVGRKGADDEPGMKFMPYMMAESIQTISEGTMSPKIAVKSRYALVEAGHHPQTMYFTFWVTVPATGIA